MSIHIGAKKGQIAEAVLLPGNPLRGVTTKARYLVVQIHIRPDEDVEATTPLEGYTIRSLN